MAKIYISQLHAEYWQNNDVRWRAILSQSGTIMTSLGLRLAALSNNTFRQIRDGNTDEGNAYYIVQLSVKYWHCGGDAALAPLRLLNRLEFAQKQRSDRAMDTGGLPSFTKHELLKRKLRLELILEEVMEEIERQLKACSTRADAALLCRIFSLGKVGIGIWEKAYFGRRPTMPRVNSRPKYRSNARNAAAKRKQAPTAVAPDNLLPAPPATKSNDNEDEDEITSPVSDHDPPAFTREEPSITRVKTRFATEQVPAAAGLPTKTPLPIESTILNNNIENPDGAATKIGNSIIPTGTTPPGEDEFAAADALMSCQNGFEVKPNDDDNGGGAAAMEKMLPTEDLSEQITTATATDKKDKQVQVRGLVEGTQLPNLVCSIS